MLGDAQTRHYTHHLSLMYPLNPLPSLPSIICSPIYSPSIHFLSSHIHGALCAWPSSSFYHPPTEPITISNHLQLILHSCIRPKIKHLPMVSVSEMGTSNTDSASININTMHSSGDSNCLLILITILFHSQPIREPIVSVTSNGSSVFWVLPNCRYCSRLYCVDAWLKLNTSYHAC
ncbi:unnamed protein product, partial [Vitis vinifera]|uniref:Uncharacterized protein n=1 Tax=Vitis vinifera TaxID=29760 RepID=D7TUF2_VITVI